MIIELTKESTGQPVVVNLDKVTYMEIAWQSYFNPMRDAMDLKECTDIHFENSKIRVSEKYDDIWANIERLSDLGKVVRVVKA